MIEITIEKCVDNFDLLLEGVLNGERKAISCWIAYADQNLFSQSQLLSAIERLDHILDDNPLHSYALYLRAYMHIYGQGGEVNHSEGIRLLGIAMELKNPSAINCRGFMYFKGEGGPVNYSEAIRLFEIALALGNPVAMRNRAIAHQMGIDGEVSHPETIRLYEMAILHGDAASMYLRATMYVQGEGGDVNIPEAIRLYRMAVEHGCLEAIQPYLALCDHPFIEAIRLLPMISRASYLGYQGSTKATDDVLAVYYQRYVSEAKDGLPQLQKFESEKNSAKAAYYLTLIHLHGIHTAKDESKANYYFNKYSKEITERLYEELGKRFELESNDPTPEQTKKMLEFAMKMDNTLPHQIGLKYFYFKQLLREGSDQEGLRYFYNELPEHPLTAIELFRLGSAQEGLMGFLSEKEEQRGCLQNACEFFYQGWLLYEDADCKTILTRLVRHLNALEGNKLHAENEMQREECEKDKELFDLFVAKRFDVPARKSNQISAIQAFITSRQLSLFNEEKPSAKFLLFSSNQLRVLEWVENSFNGLRDHLSPQQALVSNPNIAKRLNIPTKKVSITPKHENLSLTELRLAEELLNGLRHYFPINEMLSNPGIAERLTEHKALQALLVNCLNKEDSLYETQVQMR